MTLSKADIGTLSLCCRTPAFLRFFAKYRQTKRNVRQNGEFIMLALSLPLRLPCANGKAAESYGLNQNNKYIFNRRNYEAL